MSQIIVIRKYKLGDEISCREIVRNGIMASLNSTFFGTLFKEITFEFMILLAAIMFIFFGFPLAMCILVVPVVVIIIYLGIYFNFSVRSMEINNEISNISRIYMSNAFSCFWVAEAFEPYFMNTSPKEVHYKVMTEEQFRISNIDISSKSKKIVGTIALLKAHRVYKGAWIKRLYVNEKYRRKGIASCLLRTVIQFAIELGYSSVNCVASEYTDGGRELCLKQGFELKQLYHKYVLGSLITVLMYELTYQIKLDELESIPYAYRQYR